MQSDNEILEQILVWTRVGFYSAAGNMLAEVLDSDKKRWAYQLADGTRTSTAIRTQVRMSPNDVGALFRRCISVGLMDKDEAGHARRSFDLTNFGMIPLALTEERGDDEQAAT